MILKESIDVQDNKEKFRIVDYILKGGRARNKYSRNFLKKLIIKHCVTLNDKTAGTADIPEPGNNIKIYEPELLPRKIYKLHIPVIFEDDYLAVINKPAGVIVSGNQFQTVENALLFNLKLSNQTDALPLPRAAHRLDSLTSGLLLIAKTRSVRQIIGDMMAKHLIQKKYNAIVTGQTPDSGIINSDIDGKKAVTLFKTIRQIPSLKCGYVSLLEIDLKTGRTHQIRIHLSQEGYPVLGDKIYGDPDDVYKGKGLFLSAVELSFLHPVTNKQINLKIAPPNKFELYLKREKKRSDILNN